MSGESDLAFGLLALRMGRVPRVLLVDAVCAWLNETDAATVGVAGALSLHFVLWYAGGRVAVPVRFGRARPAAGR